MPKQMSRLATGVAGAMVVLATLTGCGQSEYCKTIDENKVALSSLGEQRSNDAYLTYARSLRAVAAIAPAAVRKDWAELADVTQAVVTAQRKAGIRLEEMTVDEKLTQVSTENLKLLSDAYEAFNDTAEERKAVENSSTDECGISLT